MEQGIGKEEDDHELILGAISDFRSNQEDLLRDSEFVRRHREGRRQVFADFTITEMITYVKDQLQMLLTEPLDPQLRKFRLYSRVSKRRILLLTLEDRIHVEELMSETIHLLSESLGRISLDCPSLKLLHLQNMGLSDEAMTAISKGNWVSLKELNIRRNCITWKGIRTLCQTKFEELITFNASHNKLGNKALKELSRTQWPRLRNLILQGSQVTSDGVKYLRKAGLLVPHMYLPSPNQKSIVVSLTKLSTVVFSSMSYELTSRIRNIVELVEGRKLHKSSFYCLMLKIRDLIENDPRISAWKNEPPGYQTQQFNFTPYQMSFKGTDDPQGNYLMGSGAFPRESSDIFLTLVEKVGKNFIL